MDPELLRRLQEIVNQFAQSGNSAAMTSEQLSQALRILASQVMSTSKDLGGAGNALASLTPKASLAGQVVNAFAQAITGYIGVQARLTKSVIDFQTSVYDSEGALNNLSKGLDAQYEYMTDLATSTVGPFQSLLKEIPGIGDFIGVGAEALQQTISVIQSANQRSMKVLTDSFSAMQSLNGQFGTLTLNLEEFSGRAANAGLTSDQFSRMLGSNAATLSKTFGGNQAAASALSEQFAYLKDTGKDVRSQFVAMGLSNDDMAEAMSEFAFQQRLITGKTTLDNMNLAQSTLSYQKNLSAIAAITGQNVKEQQAQRRDLLNQANFAAKIDQLKAEGREDEARALTEAVTAASAFGEGAKKVAIEQALFGQVVSKEANIIAMTQSEITKATAENIAATKGFTGTQEEAIAKFAKTYDDAGAGIAEERKNMSGLTQMSQFIQGDFGAALQASYTDTRDHINRLGTLADTFNGSIEQANTAVSGMASTIAEEDRRQQAMRVTTEQRGMDLGPTTLAVASAFQTMTEDIDKSRQDLISGFTTLTNDLVAQGGKLTPEAIFEMLMGDPAAEARKKQANEQAAQSYDKREQQRVDDVKDKTSSSTGEFITDYFQSGNFATGKIVGDVLEVREIKEQNQAAKSYSLGGIAKGPDTGYRAMLHGTEAVVPLPDGKTIPVDFDVDKLNASLSSAMAGVLANNKSGSTDESVTRLLEQSVNLNSQILDTLKQGNKTTNKMVRVMS